MSRCESRKEEQKQVIDIRYTMLIRRLPQPSLTRRCLVRVFGKRVDPLVETLNVAHDNYLLAKRLRNNPHLYDQVSTLSCFPSLLTSSRSLFATFASILQIVWQYRVRCISEYQRACEDALTPDPKPEIKHNVPVHVTGMTSRGAKWTT